MKPLHEFDDDELARLVRRAAALPDAPPALVKAAVALFASTRPASVVDAARAALRVVQAVLRFDSAAQPAVALGMRSAGESTRHLLYSAQGRDIDLRLSCADGAFALSGQVLGPDEVGIVELAPAGERPAATRVPLIAALDELGEFKLDAVPPGTWRLMLRLGNEQIVLPPLEVGAASR